MCMRHDVRACVRDHLGHRGVAAQRGDVVDELGAELERAPSDLRLRRVDGDAGARDRPSSTGTTRRVPRRAATGARPAASTRRRCRRGRRPRPRVCRACATASAGVDEPAAVGEAVGRDVEDAHDGRPRPALLERLSRAHAATLEVAPSDTRARIALHGHTCVEHRPARAAERHRLRNPDGDHHPRDLHAVLGLQDPGRGEEPLRAGCRRRSRPRHLHRRLASSRGSSSRPRSGRCIKQDGRPAPFSGWTGLWLLLPIIGAFVWFIKIQGALNRYWESKTHRLAPDERARRRLTRTARAR